MDLITAEIASWEMIIFYYIGVPVNLAAMLVSLYGKQNKLTDVVAFLAIVLNFATVPFIVWAGIVTRNSNPDKPFPAFEAVLSLFLIGLSVFYLVRRATKKCRLRKVAL